MTCPVICRLQAGGHSYLVLDTKPLEYLRHLGFLDEFEIRPWLGSLDPVDAMEEWAAMMGEDHTMGGFLITDSDNWEFQAEITLWKNCPCPA